MKSYPTDEATTQQFIKEHEHIIDKNGLHEISQGGREKTRAAYAFYTDWTSTKLGLAIFIIATMFIVFFTILLIMGFGHVLGSGNPVGIIKAVIVFSMLAVAWVMFRY